MSIRRQLYAIQSEIPGGDPAQRIISLGRYLESLPEDEVAAAERRLLATAIVMRDFAPKHPKLTLEEFFAEVDAEERRMSN